MIKRKKLRQILVPAGVIIPGIIISILGLYYVSQQKASREINLQKEYKLRVNEVRERIENDALISINRVFTELAELDPDISDPSSVLDTVKSLVVNHPIIRYPFILDAQGEYIFPVTGGKRKQVPKSPDLAYTDPAVRPLYIEGRELEFSRTDITGALSLYSECLKKISDHRVIPYVYNAMARCYFKTGRFHQASYYYQSIIRDHQNEISRDLPLWLTVLRQEALSQKNLGLIPSALNHYLTIYELIIKDESISGPGRFEMFKNEALDNLSGYREWLKDTDMSKYTAANLPDLQKTTDLDRVLDWRFTESPGEDGGNSTSDPVNEERFLKLRELNTPSDEKTWFYRIIRNKLDQKSMNENKNIRSFLFFPLNRNVDIGLGRLGKAPGQDAPVFGFMISGQYIIDNYFTGKESGRFTPGNTALKIEYNTNRDPGETDVKGAQRIMYTPFENILTGYSLALYSSDPGLFKTLAGREVWINYGLIILLITVLILGTILFQKYIIRESELLRSKAEFIDRVSHTLKTPLTRMGLLAENILAGWITDEKKKEAFLQNIISETGRMNETINNMLNFSQIDAGKKHYRFEKISVTEVIGEYLRANEEEFSGYAPGVRAELEEGLPMITGDRDGILLILSNLVQNAVKYSPGIKDIRITLKREKEFLRLEVSDRGIGINAGDRKKIFDKFFRAPDSAVSVVEGSGLGLFLAAHAAAAHGGRMEVESEPGEGAAFIVFLPLDDKMEKQ